MGKTDRNSPLCDSNRIQYEFTTAKRIIKNKERTMYNDHETRVQDESEEKAQYCNDISDMFFS